MHNPERTDPVMLSEAKHLARLRVVLRAGSQMLTKDGGAEGARRLLHMNEPSDGFTALWRHGRPNLSVEAHGLRPEFAALFTEEERAIARDPPVNPRFAVMGRDSPGTCRL